jgi:hypothetical protein
MGTWRVLPHEPIERLEPNLWRVVGHMPPGMPLRRVMTVMKCMDGGLLIHNAVALDDASMRDLEAFGPIAQIIVPNAFHRMDVGMFKERYPLAKIFCPDGALKKVREVVSVDGTYKDLPADASIRAETIRGTNEFEGYFLIQSGEHKTLVLNDLVFNMPHAHGFKGWVLRSLTNSTGGPRISRVAKWFFIKDRKAFVDHMTELANTPGLSRIIVSHHNMIETAPKETILALL